MKTSNAIVWIDDNPDRARTAEDIGALFVDVRNEDVAETVENLLESGQPRLIILDHVLDKTATKNPIFQRGSTIAEAIKEHWPACPVVGVTNVEKAKKIDERTYRTYDDLFLFVNFAKYRDRIDSISKGFLVVTKANPKKARDLVALLKPPEDEIDRLVDALPDDLKKSFRDPSLASRLYSWVDHLIERPGFLYDGLWAATFLGLNESGFEVAAENFKQAKYSGVFARDDDPRWWSSKLSELLYKLCEPTLDEPSWRAGRGLPSIKKEHYSFCYYCKEEFPETVAFLDDAGEERRPMHLRHTVLHPLFKRELYFEDIRMMREK